MAILLLVILLGIYLILGLSAKRYTVRVRLLLTGATLILPAWFYFIW